MFIEKIRDQLLNGWTKNQKIEGIEKIHNYILFLEEETKYFVENNLIKINLYNLYFEQNQQLIDENQEHQKTDRVLKLSQMFEFYDKLKDLHPLNIKSNFFIAVSFQYDHMYRQLPPTIRAQLSNRGEDSQDRFEDLEFVSLKQAFACEFRLHKNIGDVSYFLYYDVCLNRRLKRAVQKNMSIFHFVDQVIVEHLESQLKWAQKKEKEENKKEKATKTKQDVYNTTLHLRWQSKARFEKFIHSEDLFSLPNLDPNQQQMQQSQEGKAPFVGRFAFPGGHLDYNEDPQECVARELLEETGLKALSVKLHDVKGHPTRDPRGHYVSIVFLVEIPEDQIPQAGDDAATAQWYSLEEVVQKGPDAFAFDHHEILLSISQ
ncbi:hypothetical protein pb186bvf_009166 [Paramecium bursaria]